VTTTVIINLVALSLLAYQQLHAGHFSPWPWLLYLCFVLFLGVRARGLKSRVAELVDLAAYRAGLQRIRRKGVKPEPASPTASASAGAG
jgi:hypothetical protein